MHVLPVFGGSVQWQDTCQILAAFMEVLRLVTVFGKIT